MPQWINEAGSGFQLNPIYVLFYSCNFLPLLDSRFSMSHISHAVNELLATSNLTASRLARSAAFNPAQIYRIRNGEQTWISPSHLNAFAEVFAKRISGQSLPAVHAQLLCAHLRDECVGPGAKHIVIEFSPKDGLPAEHMTSPKPVLPARMQQNLDIIADHIAKSRLAQDLIEGIANWFRSIPPSN
jgi:hypothetical protein